MFFKLTLFMRLSLFLGANGIGLAVTSHSRFELANTTPHMCAADVQQVLRISVARIADIIAMLRYD